MALFPEYLSCWWGSWKLWYGHKHQNPIVTPLYMAQIVWSRMAWLNQILSANTQYTWIQRGVWHRGLTKQSLSWLWGTMGRPRSYECQEVCTQVLDILYPNTRELRYYWHLWHPIYLLDSFLIWVTTHCLNTTANELLARLMIKLKISDSITYSTGISCGLSLVKSRLSTRSPNIA